LTCKALSDIHRLLLLLLQLSDVADEVEDKIRGLVGVNAASELVNTTPRPPSLRTQG